MVDSDHDIEEGKDVQGEQNGLVMETPNKRPRDESDDEVELSTKKRRKEKSQNDKEQPNENGKHTRDQKSNDEKMEESIDDTKAESEKIDDTETFKEGSIEGKSEETSKTDNYDHLNKTEENSTKHEKMDKTNEDDDNNSEKSGKAKKKRKEDSEIINGVELTVECASDQESEEESEKEEDSKPRPKTIIVREKPNDSELDASSSEEEEKSDSYKILEAKPKATNSSEHKTEKNLKPKADNNVNTETKTPIRKKVVKRTVISKASVPDLEDNSAPNTDDEDHSPKKRAKKSASPIKTPEVKRGRGRPPKTDRSTPVKSERGRGGRPPKTDRPTPVKSEKGRGRPSKSASKVRKELSDDHEFDTKENQIEAKKSEIEKIDDTEENNKTEKTDEIEQNNSIEENDETEKNNKMTGHDETEKNDEKTGHDETDKNNDSSRELKHLDNSAASKNEESMSDDSNDEKSEEKNDEVDVKDGKQRKPSTRNEEKIKNLKRYIRTAGLRVKCYATLLKDCKTDASKAKCLARFLEENGIVGRPTLEKCKQFRIKNETLKEVQELDTGTIISETRTTRGRNTRKSQVEAESPTVQKIKTPMKRIKALVDSDSE